MESKYNPDFKKVQIGNQIWMSENLNVDKFRNGDPIPEANSSSEWEKAGIDCKPAWCYYSADPDNEEIFGKLYNWYAVIDPRGIAPEGWHVPSNKEWKILIEYLGGKESEDESDTSLFYASTVGGKMKSTGTQYRNSPNFEATNSSGFSGLPCGCRLGIGFRDLFGDYGFWWSSSEFVSGIAWVWILFFDNDNVFNFFGGKEFGYSVRCLRD